MAVRARQSHPSPEPRAPSFEPRALTRARPITLTAAERHRLKALAHSHVYQGIGLGPDEYVISSDEKTSIRARCRCHPTLAPGVARMMRVYHEYNRGGALAYPAAYEVHRAQVFSHCSLL